MTSGPRGVVDQDRKRSKGVKGHTRCREPNSALPLKLSALGLFLSLGGGRYGWPFWRCAGEEHACVGHDLDLDAGMPSANGVDFRLRGRDAVEFDFPDGGKRRDDFDVLRADGVACAASPGRYTSVPRSATDFAHRT